jgi:pimeloyl-ACP methyl ester carboxylesterase
VADVLAEFQRRAIRGVCDTGRYRCSYYAWGQGPALLFIPGLCDDALSFILPIALLSQDFRCIAYDMPTGRGDGARLSRYRPADYVNDVLALLAHLHVNSSYLFGSSFGSTVALRALHAHPERFPRAVLQGGFAHRPLAPAEVALARMARYWPWPMQQLPFHPLLLRHAHAWPFRGAAERWQFFLGRYGTPPMTAVAHRALTLHHTDLRRLLPKIHQPILLICGDHDPLVGKTCEETLLQGLPQVVRIELADCGHMPQFSHPEVLADVVYRFLTPLSCPHDVDAGENS